MAVHRDDDAAGASARAWADSWEESARSNRAYAQLLLSVVPEFDRLAAACRTGARGERAVAHRIDRLLSTWGSGHWEVCLDRRWPGTPRANIDLIMVGPPGVVVIDVKTWAEPVVQGGRLFRGGRPADDQVDKLRAQREAISGIVAGLGVPPGMVEAIIVLAGRTMPGTEAGGVRVVGERSLWPELTRRGARLGADEVRRIHATIDRACPPAQDTSVSAARRVGRPLVLTPRGRRQPADDARDTLFAGDDVIAAAIEAQSRGPLEPWMTWLHPDQVQLVVRSISGPARIRGAAGTGKSVVALHRAHVLARQPEARVLVTSHVRALPSAQGRLFERLAPDLVHRVEFRGLHSWASRLLRSRGITPRLTDGDAAFTRAWDRCPSSPFLSSVVADRHYWRDEIRTVIKGRGLSELTDYLSLTRVGRRVPLREDARIAIWDLFSHYEEELRSEDASDYDDLLGQALSAVRAEAVQPPYTAVIVDEVQDLTCVGLRLVHAVVGDRPDGLLLVGDGQQSVYPGGCTLSEAGINVAGRGTVLTRNYRNAETVYRRASTVLLGDSFHDLDPVPTSGGREMEFALLGGQVAEVVGDTRRAQAISLAYAVEWTVHHGTPARDMAILLPSNSAVATWKALLERCRLRTVEFRDEAPTTDLPRIGTYVRSKGLEFTCVFLPDVDRAVGPMRPEESADAAAERQERERRQLFVAMTRARDRLWLGRTLAPEDPRDDTPSTSPVPPE